jgi:hypothetical protein
MGTKEKLIERFKKIPKDITYEEVKRLFGCFGYKEGSKESTSCSRVEFVSPDGKETFIMHKPHPSNIIRGYVMKQIYDFFPEHKLI